PKMGALSESRRNAAPRDYDDICVRNGLSEFRVLVWFALLIGSRIASSQVPRVRRALGEEIDERHLRKAVLARPDRDLSNRWIGSRQIPCTRVQLDYQHVAAARQISADVEAIPVTGRFAASRDAVCSLRTHVVHRNQVLSGQRPWSPRWR